MSASLLQFSFIIVEWILKLTTTLIVLLVVWILQCRWRWWTTSQTRRRRLQEPNTNVLAFYHPYCAAGGGGERVLWKMIQALEEKITSSATTTTTTNHPNNENPTTTTTTTNSTKIRIVIYTIDPPSENYLADLMEHVKSRFDIVLTGALPISFVHLHQYKHLLKSAGFLTLLAESIGTMRLAYHALRLHVTNSDSSLPPLPNVYIDTTGCAFTYLIPKCLVPQCRVVAYVHYPTISTDMLQVVYQRRPSYNHNVDIAKSTLTTYLKLLYYCFFAMAYGIMGSLADLVLVNSTWTYQHIRQLWGWADVWIYDRWWWRCWWRHGGSNNNNNNNNSHPQPSPRIQILFPPCNVARLNHLPLGDNSTTMTPTNNNNSTFRREAGWIVSIGQFRPEKDHPLQLRALALLLRQHPELIQQQTSFSIKLILIGSCRSGTEDEQRVEDLRQLASELNISDHVVWVLNQPTSIIVEQWLRQASIGIHSMWNEHFGIAIVEMMAAGLVMIAHDSGGPQTDIIGPSLPSGITTASSDDDDDDDDTRTGFLASTVEEYARVLYQVMTMSKSQRLDIRKRARASVERFSDQVFVSSFQRTMIQSGILGDDEQVVDSDASKKDK